MKIKGKTALITGGASGMGAAVAEALHQKEANIIIIDKEDAMVSSVLPHKNILYKSCDVSDYKKLNQIFEKDLGQYSIDICVNCAGIAPAFKVVSKDGNYMFEQFKKVIEVNLMGTFNIVALVFQKMAQNKSENENGIIINTSSVAAFEGQIGQSAYSASKGGVAAMTLPLAREFAKSKIRVNTIAPGLIQTPLLGKLSLEVIARLQEQIPFPSRLGYVTEFANLAVHLIENEYINGEVIRLDGALRMPSI